jgi:predicted SAM-dependent methyltransferase
MFRINVGCGQTPTKGWRNFDNSPSLLISKYLIIPKLLVKTGLLEESQYKFIQFARANAIEYADVTKRIPLPDSSVEVLYSSHMLEHLDRNEAKMFFSEAKRVLKKGGCIRLVLPDLNKLIAQYIKSNDADAFILKTLLTHNQPRTFVERLKLAMVGARNHQWMYDAPSLTRLLLSHGFEDIRIMGAGETSIKNPHGLNLFEREPESVYVEAIVPTAY